MSILQLPDSIMVRIIYFLVEPEFEVQQPNTTSNNPQPTYNAVSTDPRDAFNLICTCRRFRDVFTSQNGQEFLQSFKTEFEKVFRRSRRSASLVDAPGTMSIVIGVLDQPEGKKAYKALPSKPARLQEFQGIILNRGSPTMLGDSRRSGDALEMSTQLTEVQKDLLRELGRNWISMFMSGQLSLGDVQGKEREALDIMENLSSFIVGVLCCHVWSETGRFTMLCRTRVNDFMLLHGIDGLWQEQQCYPFVIFGASKLTIAQSIYSALVHSDYGSIRDTGGHPLWSGFGLDT